MCIVYISPDLFQDLKGPCIIKEIYKMKILKFISGILLIFIAYSGFSQTSVGDYQSGFKTEGNTVYFSNSQADVRLEFCTPSMFRVRTSWDHDFAADEPWMVIQYDWPEVALETEELDDKFLLKTKSLTIRINKSPFAIDVYNKDGDLITAETIEQGGGRKENHEVTCSKKLMPNEHFFGFGERMDFIDQRGKKVELNVGRGEGRPHIVGAYNILEANYCPVPFFMSTRGYGIFFHNSYATEWDMGYNDTDRYSFKAEGGALDYYFIYGPQFFSILDQYTDLTGKSPLMPRFALGLHLGTYSGGTWGHEQNTSTQYVVNLVKKFRELGIPLDILHLDSTWRIFGDIGGKGATTFEWRSTFDDPKAMMDSLYDLNISMVGVHVRPRFDNGKHLDLLAQARASGYVYPEEDQPGEFVNFFDPESVEWWWQNGVMKVASIGVKFLKTDEGSAFGHKANESEKTGPVDLEAKRLHNVFPIAYAKAPYEKFQGYNGVRGMNLAREGYAGIQRYPFIFAGDWPSEWQYFAPVVKAGINIGISGVGYWTHCMGGFEHVADPELYVRWVQFGMLSPVAHLFGMDHPDYKEPWNYGEEALKIFTKYDRLRYRLIPYLYSEAYGTYETGKPLMRALVLEYQNDENVYDIGDQYLFGDNMMVCPVTTKGAKTRIVYLPEGKWTNYWTGEKYAGRQYLNVVSPLDQIPIFVKEGAIIPMQESMNYVGEKQVDHLELDIYPGSTSQFIVYDDDGKSLDYQKGKFASTKVSCNASNDQVEININKPKGDYDVPERTYSIKLHMPSGPQKINSDKGDLKEVKDMAAFENASNSWYYNKKEGVLLINAPATSKKNISIEITK